MNALSNLNDRQRAAVESADGPTLIVAGPGTGKTKTLTARIAHLVTSGRAKPGQILALTFTTKAAREMSERVEALVGESTVTISTFHALCYRLLQKHQNGTIQLITEADRAVLVRHVAKQAKGIPARELSLRISQWKGVVQPPDEPALADYNAELKQRNLLDYDDLLAQVYHAFQNDSIFRAAYQDVYRYVLIDEFQDTSELQWEIVKLLRPDGNIVVIGDPKQSIYSFRGAGGEMFGCFQADFPNHHLVELTTNYRSARSIVTLANAIFPAQTPLSAHATELGSVQALQTLNEYSEADLVLHTIEQGIGGSDMLKAGTHDGGLRFRDFAVVYRTHHSAKALQQRLHDSGIPYQIVGEDSPYAQPEVRALIDCLRWLHQRDNPPAVKGFTPPQAARLLEDISLDQPLSQLAEAVVQVLHLDGDDARKRQRLSQFISTCVRFDGRPDGLARCLAHVDAIAAQEFYDPAAEAVTLLTIHASKGLEFEHVILIAAEEGTLPHIRKTAEPNIDEERRLFYVAATRAKRSLDIVHAKNRAGEERGVSRFVAELTEPVLPRVSDPNLAALEKKLRRRQQKARQATLFR